MEHSIYNDFFSSEELAFITGRKQKKRIIAQLNAMGIPFITNANGFPIVRRDYNSTPKNKTKTTANIPTQKQEWIPNVLRN